MSGVGYMELGIACALLAGLSVALEVGFRLGRRSVRAHEAPSSGQVGAIQGATLGLLGLLLGFSFAGAAARFLERQDLIVQESNAIGTAFLRADLIADPFRADLKSALAEYVRHRLELSPSIRRGLAPEVHQQVAEFHDRIWKAASAGSSARPETVEVVLPPVNEVIDLHTCRVAAGRKHLPSPVMALLVVCSVLAIGVIGYGCGMSNRRCLIMTGSLAVLIAATLWIIIDLDHPRAGWIQLSDAPLAELKLK